ncbi:MAG TPA: YqgE/AlgH family protein [Patescibacteria group bacterium]|nr:YqgE/AlgH family protein [Patescibacteria group bacterium]
MMAIRELKVGDILVAHPGLDADPDFARSVLLIVKHGDTGTLAVNIAGAEVLGGKILRSGPIEGKAILLLAKTGDTNGRPQVRIGDTGYSARGIYPDAAGMKLLEEKPDDALLLMGYAGFKKGAIVKQLEEGIWSHAGPVTLEQLIRTPREERWAVAANGINFDPPQEAPKPTPKKKNGRSFDL